MTAPLISVILPWYRRMSLFRQALPQNRLFLDPRVEVILVLDEPSEEKALLQFLNGRSGRFKVVVNDQPHSWRPPCRAINVGIRHAQGIYVAIMSPETMINPPSNEYLFSKLAALKDPRFFITGSLFNIEFTLAERHYDHLLFADVIEYRRSVLAEPSQSGYGLLICPKKILEVLHGMDESRQKYGGDDDDLRQRLRLFGCQEINDANLRLIHMWHNDSPRTQDPEPYGQRIILYDQPSWGTDFNRVAYDTTSPCSHTVSKRRTFFARILRSFKPVL